MSRFTHVPLCTFPAGPKSGAQARKAREMIRAAVPGGKEVALLSVTDPDAQTHSLVAWWDADLPLAAAWVCEAEKAAPHIRELVAGMGTREMVR